MKRIIFFFFLANSTILISQNPILWQRTIGGSESEDLNSIIETHDGGYLLGGNSNSNISGEKTENSRGGDDYWIVKLSEEGNIEWQKTIGGSDNDRVMSIIQTEDGGYLLGGYSESGISGDKTENSKGGNDYWIIKLNDDGNIEWQKTIGGSDNDRVMSIIQTSDENYVIAGSSYSEISGDRTAPLIGVVDAWIIKINTNGNILWQKSYGIEYSAITNIIETSDLGLVFTGTIIANDNEKCWFFKLDSSGEWVWEKIYGGNGIDWGRVIIQTSDEGYLAAGASDTDISGDKTEPSNGDFDYWILKLDDSGAIVWQQSIGGAYGESPHSIIESAEGGYFISGYSSSNTSGDKTEDSRGQSDYWIIKINEVGIIEWQKTIGGLESDTFCRAVQNSDGDYLIGGSSHSNISGEKTENSRGNTDYWVVKYSHILGITENYFSRLITIHPNPAQDILKVDAKDRIIDTVIIYSISGNQIQKIKKNAITDIDISRLSSGMYYIQLHSQDDISLKPFIKK